MGISKKNIFIVCCFIQSALFSQIWLGVRVSNPYNKAHKNSVVCTNSDGEINSAVIQNDSLYFQAKGVMQTVVPVKNKTNFNSIPAIACDNTQGQFQNRIYICWSDEKNGINNKDVFIVYSDDKGKTWTEPILVTYHPNHKDQFMPALFIDETGIVYVLYYDTQNYFTYGKTDITMAVSKNGGLKFDHYQMNLTPVKQNLRIQTETSLSLTTERKKIIAGWKPIKKEQSEFAIFDEGSSYDLQKNNSKEITFEKTIAFTPEIKLNYEATTDVKLTAILTKPLLAGYEKIIVKDLNIKKGNNQLLIDTKKLGVQKGNYVLTLYYNGKNDFAWITEE